MDEMLSRLKPSSRRCAKHVAAGSAGFTMLELLLSMTIMLVAGAIAFSVAFGARRLYDADSTRMDVNQALRSATDMVTTEIRQAGEKLPPDFPAVELVSNANGDRLILRKAMMESVLQSCLDRSGGHTRIRIGLTSGSGGCVIVADGDTDGYPDNIQEFREYRLANGDATDELDSAYLFDPVTGNGEWLNYTGEVDAGSDQWELIVDAISGTYPATNQPRVYILDESRYDLASGRLELRRDGSNSGLGIVEGVTDFQVSFLMQDGSTETTFDNSDNWSQIRRIRFDLAAERELRDRTVSRSLTANVFPRAILSN
jgi:type IV pilus assembly protein PilW